MATKSRINGRSKPKQSGSKDASFPFDHDVERRLLSCLLIDPAGQFPRVLAAGLQTHHFHHDAHRILYGCLGALWQTHAFFDTTLVTDFLTDQGDIDRVGYDYVGEILVASATASSAPHYAEILLRHAKRRAMAEAGNRFLDAIAAGEDADGLLGSTIATFSEIERSYAAGAAPIDGRLYLDSPVPEIDPLVQGLLDREDKFFIVGPSKARKTFMVTQLALELARGGEFLRWDVVRPCCVAILQMEVKPAHFQRRVKNMAMSLGVTSKDIGDRLRVVNLRGVAGGLETIPDSVDVAIMEPFYKLLGRHGASEKEEKDVTRVLLEIDSWITRTGGAFITAHHGTKGRIGDKAVVDRASGSGNIARDLDGAITIAPHRDCPEDLLVVEHLARNYPSEPAFVVEFEDGRFVVREGIEPVVETSESAGKRRQVKGLSIDELAKEVADTITVDEETEAVRNRIQTKYGLGLNKADRVIRALEGLGFRRWKSNSFPSKGMIGPECPEEWTA